MVEETPSRMKVGYRIAIDEETEVDLLPVGLRDENNVTIDDDYSRKISFHSPSMFTAEHDSSYMQLNLSYEPTLLNRLNYVNVASYLAHVFVSYGIGVRGLGGILPSHWEISQKFDTLVMPAKWAYLLWAPILTFEAIFAGAQLLKDFRSRPIIQDGTGYFFFYTCLIQTAWTLFFSLRLFIPSFLCVVAAFASLASLLVSQHRSQVRGRQSWVEYWMFRFPFFLHCGWMAVMVAVNFTWLCRNETSNIGTQLAVDMIALAVLLPLATFLLWSGDHLTTDFVIPSVIVWSYIGIAWRLHHPSDVLLEDYGHDVIDAVRLTSYILAAIVTALMIPRLIVCIGRRFFTIQVVTMQEDSIDTYSR